MYIAVFRLAGMSNSVTSRGVTGVGGIKSAVLARRVAATDGTLEQTDSDRKRCGPFGPIVVIIFSFTVYLGRSSP